MHHPRGLEVVFPHGKPKRIKSGFQLLNRDSLTLNPPWKLGEHPMPFQTSSEWLESWKHHQRGLEILLIHDKTKRIYSGFQLLNQYSLTLKPPWKLGEHLMSFQTSSDWLESWKHYPRGLEVLLVHDKPKRIKSGFQLLNGYSLKLNPPWKLGAHLMRFQTSSKWLESWKHHPRGLEVLLMHDKPKRIKTGFQLLKWDSLTLKPPWKLGEHLMSFQRSSDWLESWTAHPRGLEELLRHYKPKRIKSGFQLPNRYRMTVKPPWKLGEHLMSFQTSSDRLESWKHDPPGLDVLLIHDTPKRIESGFQLLKWDSLTLKPPWKHGEHLMAFQTSSD